MTDAPIDWYERRHELRVGDVFTTIHGDVVQLDRRVPGDGTQWYVLDWSPRPGHPRGGVWFAEDSTIEPGDLVARIPDPILP